MITQIKTKTKPKPQSIPINNLISIDYKTWQPKDFHKEWIRDSLQPGIPQIPWTINWEYQPLNHRIAGITRHIDTRYILIDLNPLYVYEWDHLYCLSMVQEWLKSKSLTVHMLQRL